MTVGSKDKCSDTEIEKRLIQYDRAEIGQAEAGSTGFAKRWARKDASALVDKT